MRCRFTIHPVNIYEHFFNSVFAVRATAVLFVAFVDAPFGFAHFNPRDKSRGYLCSAPSAQGKINLTGHALTFREGMTKNPATNHQPKIHGVNSNKLRCWHRISQLSVYHSPREYARAFLINPFATFLFVVRATPPLFATFVNAPLGFTHFNPRILSCLSRTAGGLFTFCTFSATQEPDFPKSGIVTGSQIKTGS